MGGTPSQVREDDFNSSTEKHGGFQENGEYIPLTPLMGNEMISSFNFDVDVSFEDPDSERKVTYKIFLTGELGSGKSSFRRRVIEGSFDEKYDLGSEQRISITQTYEYESRSGKKAYIRLDLWEPVRQDRYRSIPPMLYRGSRGIMIFFALDSRQQFHGGKRWFKELRRHFSDDCYLIMVGTKSDLSDDHEKEVFFEEDIQDWVNDNNIQYVETSAKLGKNVYKAMGMLMDGIIGDEKRYFDRYHNVPMVSSQLDAFKNVKT